MKKFSLKFDCWWELKNITIYTIKIIYQNNKRRRWFKKKKKRIWKNLSKGFGSKSVKKFSLKFDYWWELKNITIYTIKIIYQNSKRHPWFKIKK